MTAASELVKICRSMIGTPFRHRGRTARGLDCAGLVVFAFLKMGRPVVDLKSYGREPHRDGLREYVRMNLGQPAIGPIKPGDVLLMKFDSEPHHIGVAGDHALGGLSLIHSDGETGRVVEHRLDEKWAGRVIEFYRIGED